MRRFGLVAVVMALQSCAANAACGDRNEGPGYRGSEGQCVTWAALADGVCGCPPTTYCRPEHVHAGAERMPLLFCKYKEWRGGH
jgi:hypothetical protein